MSDNFNLEIRFLNKYLADLKIKWQVILLLSQLVSPALTTQEFDQLLQRCKSAFGPRSKDDFDKIFFKAPGKTHIKMAVNVIELRKVFPEIDPDWGGGGRRLNPLSTRPMRGGR